MTEKTVKRPKKRGGEGWKKHQRRRAREREPHSLCRRRAQKRREEKREEGETREEIGLLFIGKVQYLPQPLLSSSNGDGDDAEMLRKDRRPNGRLPDPLRRQRIIDIQP